MLTVVQWQAREESHKRSMCPSLRKIVTEQSADRLKWAHRMKFVKYSPIVKGDKIGRNDPCPCGSYKKYKKCCGTV